MILSNKRLHSFLIIFVILFFFFPFSPSGTAAQDSKLSGVEMTNPELDQIRGGFSGFYFGVSFNGYFDTLGNVAGSLTYNGGVGEQLSESPTLPVSQGDTANLTGNGVAIKAYVGNIDGASGIFQIVQSPGNYNVLQNNMIVQLTIINVTDESALPALIKFLPSW